MCNQGIFGNEFKLRLENPSIYFNEFYTAVYIADNSKKIDIKDLTLEFISANNFETKIYSNSESLNTFTIDSTYTDSGEIKETKLDFKDNFFKSIRTKLKVFPSYKSKYMLKINQGSDSIPVIIKKGNNSQREQILETIFDKNIIEIKKEEILNKNSTGVDFTEAEKQLEEESKICLQALENGFAKEINKKCLDVDSISCMIIDNKCFEGILTSKIQCSSNYFNSKEYEILETC